MLASKRGGYYFGRQVSLVSFAEVFFTSFRTLLTSRAYNRLAASAGSLVRFFMNTEYPGFMSAYAANS